MKGIKMSSEKSGKTMRIIAVCALVLAAVLLVLSLTGVFNPPAKYKDFNYFAMDTYVTFRLSEEGKNGRLSENYLKEVADKCAGILASVEYSISSHAEKGEVASLNSDVNVMVGASETLLAVLNTSERISKLTDGAFDYTLGPLTELWNVSGGGPKPSAKDISYAMSHTGTDKFRIGEKTIQKTDKIAKVDLGAIGKGYATQAVLEYLSTTDVSYAVVSLGGNIGIYGEKPDGKGYRIGLRDPSSPDAVMGYFEIRSGFVSVSGDYERFFEEDGVRYHHIIDPETGSPADNGLRSVAVLASNGPAADALSTALFVMGEEKAMEFYRSHVIDFEAVFVTSDGRVITTDRIDSSVFELSNHNYKLTEKTKD